MQPARYDIRVRPGDTVDLAIMLWLQQGLDRIPLVPATDDTFTLRIGSLTASTKSAAAGRLQVDVTEDSVTLRRRFLPGETSQFSALLSPKLSLVRSSVTAGRKTYLVGSVTLLGDLAHGPSDPSVDLTVSDIGISAQIALNDGGAGSAIGTIRGNVGQQLDTLEKVEAVIGGLATKGNLADALTTSRSILTLSGNPTSGAIPAGQFRIVKNTATGRFSVWANDGGTMVDLLTLATV